MRSDDLVPFLGTPQPAGRGVTFRQGVIVAWNQDTAENVVRVGDSLLTNLPILNTSEAAILAAGDVVGILVSGATWGIMGRFTIPGSPEAVSALDSLRVQSQTVGNNEATTSSSFTDLGNYGPEIEVVVGASGRVVLWMSSVITLNVPSGSGILSVEAQMAFVGEGANEFGTGSYSAIRGQLWRNSAQAGGFDTAIETTTPVSKTYLLTGLAPGLTKFVAKYRRASGAGTVSFDDRNMTAMAI